MYIMGIPRDDPLPADEIGESCEIWPWDMSQAQVRK